MHTRTPTHINADDLTLSAWLEPFLCDLTPVSLQYEVHSCSTSVDVGYFTVFHSGYVTGVRYSLGLQEPSKLTTTVLRTTTEDFVSYTPLVPVLTFETGGDPKPYTMPTVKSLARDELTNQTIMVVFASGILVYVFFLSPSCVSSIDGSRYTSASTS